MTNTTVPVWSNEYVVDLLVPIAVKIVNGETIDPEDWFMFASQVAAVRDAQWEAAIRGGNEQ